MTTQDASYFLRMALRSNAIFSAISGCVFVVASGPLSQWIGPQQPALIVAIGVSLLVFAVSLFATSRRETMNLMEAWTAVSLDTAWVIGSGIVIFSGVLSTQGNWAVAIIADIVMVFAVLQCVGIRRLRRLSAAH